MLSNLLLYIGKFLVRILMRERHTHQPILPVLSEQLLATIKVGDVLLVDGISRISNLIKYLTQSTWSHAAIYVGEHLVDGVIQPAFVEADMNDGVRMVPLSEFKGLNVRICRPIGLQLADCEKVVQYVVDRIGHKYDLRNVIDLARYLLPHAIVLPMKMRSRVLVLGSGDPTRAICSTLIAQAFQSIQYPILPIIHHFNTDIYCKGCLTELMQVRHHSLFVPKDFDLSPYFQVIKPEFPQDFNYKTLNWLMDKV